MDLVNMNKKKLIFHLILVSYTMSKWSEQFGLANQASHGKNWKTKELG